MTKERTCANDTGLPALLAHISKMQDLATRIYGLAGAMTFIAFESESHEAHQALALTIGDAAREMCEGLDSTNLPEVSA